MTRSVITGVLTVVLSVSVFAQPSYSVGAGKAEITAPPGFATGGHGPAGSVARGSWSRNWARAFVFKDPNGSTVVLV